MDQLTNINDVANSFVTGRLGFEKREFEVATNTEAGSLTFKYRKSTSHDYIEYAGGKKAYIIYSCGRQHEADARLVGLNRWLAFVWKLTADNKMSPVGVVPLVPQREPMLTKESMQQQMSAPNTIGDVENVVIVRPAGFSFSSPLKGKVDTGASMCSMHVDSWKENGQNIDFTSKALGGEKTFTVPKDTMIAIKSAEATEYRPVVIMSFRIGDNLVQDIEVNLNNRSAMKYPLLLGQNALEKGKFLIDPSKTKERYESEDVDWDYINEVVDSFDFDAQTKDARVEMQYNRLLESDVTFEELLRHIKTKNLEAVENTEY